VRPGPGEARRSLPIRREPQEIRARFDAPELRAAILHQIPADEASIEIGDEDRDWGRTVTLHLHLSAPVPGIGAQTLAGTALRRLKALCETGEIPNSDFNPAARDDAGERSA
jgi:hypothetical protein